MRYFKEAGSIEFYGYSQEDLDKASNLTLDTHQNFHVLAEKLKGMTELTGDALDLYLNPPPTVEGEREKRDQLIRELDAVVSNPLRFAELSDETKAELGAYRQLLLDVPQQNSFPTDIVWPETPSILNSGHITP